MNFYKINTLVTTMQVKNSSCASPSQCPSQAQSQRTHCSFTAITSFCLFIILLHRVFSIVIVIWSAAAAVSLQSCSTLCDPIDGSPPGSPIPGILQARTLEWVAISFSNAWKWKVKVKSLSCVRLLVTPSTAAYPSSDHGIFQAGVLEWGATAFPSWLL